MIMPLQAGSSIDVGMRIVTQKFRTRQSRGRQYVAPRYAPVAAGENRALAGGGARRLALLPNVPTIAESGVPGFDFNTWMAILAPLNTPKEIIARVNAEITKALGLPDVKERLVSIGFEIDGSSPEKLAAVTKARLEQMQKIIKDAGISIQ